MGLGNVAMAFVSAEAGRTGMGPYILNAQAPDEGNMHTLLHNGDAAAEGEVPAPARRGALALLLRDDGAGGRGLRPDAASRLRAVKDGDDWVINGHKWFISGAKGARFAILIARTDPDADPPQARNSAFLVDLPAEGWEIVRDIDTMARQGNHCEIRITNCGCRRRTCFGERGHGHLLGQYRLGPARLAHCMRWIGNAEIALEMMVDRALESCRARLDARGQAGDPVDDVRVRDGAVHRESSWCCTRPT